LIKTVILNQVKITEFTVEGDKLYMSNLINSKTLRQFEDIIKENPQIKTIIELYMLGSIDDDVNIELSYRVRELGLNTHLTAESAIYSGAVDLFISGVERSAEDGAIIGIHSWENSLKTARDYPRDHQYHLLYSEFNRKMLGSDDFYWFTIEKAPADGIYIMSNQDMKNFGILTK